MSEQVKYNLVAEWESENAKVKVYKPELTPEEYAVRFRILERATKALLKEMCWPKQQPNS